MIRFTDGMEEVYNFTDSHWHQLGKILGAACTHSVQWRIWDIVLGGGDGRDSGARIEAPKAPRGEVRGRAFLFPL